MKISTWNVERLKHKKDINKIMLEIKRVDADILVLTETDMQLKPDYPYCFRTPPLHMINSAAYKPSENRITIYTKYQCLQVHGTYDRYTALCVELQAESQPLIIYGTIMGVYGSRNQEFKDSLPKQCADIIRLAKLGKPLCICGDYNLSFADSYYFTQKGRNALLTAFEENNIRLLTSSVLECVDHIAVSDSFVQGKSVRIEEWNHNKKLSDHKGISVTIQ